MDQYFDEHLALIETAFKSIANHTNGLSSYYYRVNPEITKAVKGFFYSKSGTSDFQRIELTDLSAYEPDDMEHVGWYHLPLRHGGATWLDPHYSAKIGDQVISYAIPLYKAGTFIGIIGMDIRFETLVRQIEQFTNFQTGYFALADEDGRLYYHRDYETGTALSDVLPQVCSAVDRMDRESSGQQIIRYVKNGTKWQMAFSTLENGMKLAAVVEESEINTYANTLTKVFLITGALILLVFVAFTMISMKHVIEPLERLTAAARKLADGDYDAELNYKGSDEVGVLTETFSSMRDRLKAHFTDLRSKAFIDDLTGVKSRHAYVEAEEKLDRRIEEGSVSEYALVLFDLNDLKKINDSYGHEAGDQYIKDACRIICSCFKHSPVYRVGGDEFVAILEGEDYRNRDELLLSFEKQMDDNRAEGLVTIALGLACFDPALDKSSRTVFERADEKMYQKKKQMKK